MPAAWAASIGAAIAFSSVAVPVEAPTLDAIPIHPTIAAHGWIGFVAQDGKKRCDVSVWHVTRDGAQPAYRGPCERGDAFYNLIPGADGATPELVALGAEGLVRVFPAPRARVVSEGTFAVLSPAVRSPGPELWTDDDADAATLRLALPGLSDVTLWERESAPADAGAAGDRPASDEHWRRGERFRIAVDAQYNPRIGRDTLYPDFAILAHLRMPKWKLGRIDGSGEESLLYALENEVTGTHASKPDPASGDAFHAEKVLFPDDPNGNDPRLVRGNRLADIDGDGQLDVALVAARGGITHLETAMDVWFGPLAESLSHGPDTSFRGTGAAVGTELVDVERDKKLEALRPKVEVSIAALVRILLFGEVKVDYDFFDIVRGQHDGQHPFCSLQRGLPIDLEGLSAKAAPLFTTEGDFDGDGLADVLTGEGTKGYAILPGRRGDGGRWCPTGSEEIAIPVPKAEMLTVRDLDGDGRSDLIVIHGGEHGDSAATVLFSSASR